MLKFKNSIFMNENFHLKKNIPFFNGFHHNITKLHHNITVQYLSQSINNSHDFFRNCFEFLHIIYFTLKDLTDTYKY